MKFVLFFGAKTLTVNRSRLPAWEKKRAGIVQHDSAFCHGCDLYRAAGGVRALATGQNVDIFTR